MYKLISCWISIIIVYLFFVGASSFAQGLDSASSGWEKAHEEAMAKVEAAEKEAEAKVMKEAMAKEAKAMAVVRVVTRQGAAISAATLLSMETRSSGDGILPRESAREAYLARK